MKIRYIQFQKIKPWICINYPPDPSLGPAIRVTDERWAQIYRNDPKTWKLSDGEVYVPETPSARLPTSTRKRVIYTSAALLGAGLAVAGAVWCALQYL